MLRLELKLGLAQPLDTHRLYKLYYWPGIQGRVEFVRLALEAAGAKYLKAPLVEALHDRVAGQRRVAAYLASPRRIPFNESGIFRHCPELDG